MTRKYIESLGGKVITWEQSEEIELNEEVVNFEYLGPSGYMRGYDWYNVEFSDGVEIDVYM